MSSCLEILFLFFGVLIKFEGVGFKIVYNMVGFVVEKFCDLLFLLFYLIVD